MVASGGTGLHCSPCASEGAAFGWAWDFLQTWVFLQRRGFSSFFLLVLAARGVMAIAKPTPPVISTLNGAQGVSAPSGSWLLSFLATAHSCTLLQQEFHGAWLGEHLDALV